MAQEMKAEGWQRCKRRMLMPRSEKRRQRGICGIEGNNGPEQCCKCCK